MRFYIRQIVFGKHAHPAVFLCVKAPWFYNEHLSKFTLNAWGISYHPVEILEWRISNSLLSKVCYLLKQKKLPSKIYFENQRFFHLTSGSITTFLYKVFRKFKEYFFSKNSKTHRRLLTKAFEKVFMKGIWLVHKSSFICETPGYHHMSAASNAVTRDYFSHDPTIWSKIYTLFYL